MSDQNKKIIQRLDYRRFSQASGRKRIQAEFDLTVDTLQTVSTIVVVFPFPSWARLNNEVTKGFNRTTKR